VNKRLRTWFFPAGQEPEIGDRPEPDLWGVPNSFFTLNEKWCHGMHYYENYSDREVAMISFSIEDIPLTHTHTHIYIYTHIALHAHTHTYIYIYYVEKTYIYIYPLVT